MNLECTERSVYQEERSSEHLEYTGCSELLVCSELLDLERGAALGVPAGAHGAPGAPGRRRIGVHGALSIPGALVAGALGARGVCP